MKILFCAVLSNPSRSGWQRCQVLKELGHEVLEFHHESYEESKSLVQRIFERISHNPFDENVLTQYNHDFLKAVSEVKPDIVWVEWGQRLFAETLERAKQLFPECMYVSFQDDNPFGLRKNDRPHWKIFLESIPRYDLHFVKRVTDSVEFRKRGAKEVRIFTHGFYAPLFHPVSQEEIPPSRRHASVFIGTAIDHRIKEIGTLIRRYGMPLHIYGNSWEKHWIYYLERERFHEPVWCEDYAQVVSGSRISLGYVSSSNCDEYSMRSFEIPACGGFFLAERTEAHLSFYEEGKEAEFFSSPEECADKTRFYLRNESQRAKIAEAGHNRCVRSDYSLHRRMSDAMNGIHR